ncbi:MAG: phosphate signaling complex PhoU family protein [Candidatus Njordarchaeales archaeon]
MKIFLGRAIKGVERLLFELFDISKACIFDAINYFLTKDENFLKSVTLLEKQSNELNLQIMDKCLEILENKKPIGEDLRRTVIYIEISSFLEYLCDLSFEICKFGTISDKNKIKIIQNDIIWMVKRVISMLEINENSIKENEVKSLKNDLEKIDSEINTMFEDSKKKLINIIKEKEGELAIEDLVKSLYVIKYIERIGNIAAKLGSRIIYVTQGKHVFVE